MKRKRATLHISSDSEQESGDEAEYNRGRFVDRDAQQRRGSAVSDDELNLSLDSDSSDNTDDDGYDDACAAINPCSELVVRYDGELTVAQRFLCAGGRGAPFRNGRFWNELKSQGLQFVLDVSLHGPSQLCEDVLCGGSLDTRGAGDCTEARRDRCDACGKMQNVRDCTLRNGRRAQSRDVRVSDKCRWKLHLLESVVRTLRVCVATSADGVAASAALSGLLEQCTTSSSGPPRAVWDAA